MAALPASFKVGQRVGERERDTNDTVPRDQRSSETNVIFVYFSSCHSDAMKNVSFVSRLVA